MILEGNDMNNEELKMLDAIMKKQVENYHMKK